MNSSLNALLVHFGNPSGGMIHVLVVREILDYLSFSLAYLLHSPILSIATLHPAANFCTVAVCCSCVPSWNEPCFRLSHERAIVLNVALSEEHPHATAQMLLQVSEDVEKLEMQFRDRLHLSCLVWY